MSRFSNIAKRRKLDKPITGAGGYLDIGVHNVVIEEVDISHAINNDRIKVKFKDMTQSAHQEVIWLISKYGDNYSNVLIKFINALFQDVGIYEVLDTAFSNESIQEVVFKSFEKLQLRITLERSPGYLLVTTNNTVIIQDAITEQPLDSRTFSNIAEAREAAQAKGLRRSWKKVKTYEALDDTILADNRKKFNSSIERIEESTKLFGNLGQIFSGDIFSSITQGG